MQNQPEPMDASQQFCPKEACSARGKIAEGNIRIHSYDPQRYRCQKVHQAIVGQGRVDAHHVQADEIRVKGCQLIAWMGLAIDVSTRLWMAGVVSRERDKALADQLVQRRECISSEVPTIFAFRITG